MIGALKKEVETKYYQKYDRRLMVMGPKLLTVTEHEKKSYKIFNDLLHL